MVYSISIYGHTFVILVLNPGHRNLFDLFGFKRRFQHCTGHITVGSFVGRGNQYIQLVKVLYCKLPTISKQLSDMGSKV